MNKIETRILNMILTEAIFLLFLFKYNFINIILGIILGIILIKITKNIKRNKYTKLLLNILAIILYIVVLYQTTYFINDNILKNYSTIIIMISLIILSIVLIYKKYHYFIKTVEILFYIIIFLKLISLILCIPLINFSNFTFHFDINYQLIYVSLFILILYKNIYYLTNVKIKTNDILLSFINVNFIKSFSLLILGNKLTNIYKYPYINFLKRIKYFNIIERIDGILSFEYLFCFIILLSFLLITIIQNKKPKKWLINYLITSKS